MSLRGHKRVGERRPLLSQAKVKDLRMEIILAIRPLDEG